MGAQSESADSFKQCTLCGHVWATRNGFLSDEAVRLIGYQAFLPDPILGLFMFNHDVCETTLAIEAEKFQDLYDGPIYRENKHDTDDCSGYCDSEDELRPCPVECECAWVREILEIVGNWPKKGHG